MLLALFAVLAVLVTQDRAPLGVLDDLGRDAEAWADDHEVARRDAALDRAWLTATVAKTIATIAVMVVLLLRKQARAALFTGAVMLVTALVTPGSSSGWRGQPGG